METKMTKSIFDKKKITKFYFFEAFYQLFNFRKSENIAVKWLKQNFTIVKL